MNKSLEGLKTATVFQVYDLLNAYHQVYQREIDEDTGWVALALAIKLRESKFNSLAKDPKRLAALQVRESEVFAAALQQSAFLTLYDKALILAKQQGFQALRELNCCAELTLFGSLNWTPEEIVQAAQIWVAGQKPIQPDPILSKIANKYKLKL